MTFDNYIMIILKINNLYIFQTRLVWSFKTTNNLVSRKKVDRNKEVLATEPKQEI